MAFLLLLEMTLAALLLIPTIRAGGRRSFAPLPVLALLGAFAVVLRFVFAEGTLYHEFYHGFRYVEQMRAMHFDHDGAPSSVLLLVGLLARPFGGGDDAIFSVNAVLNGLAAPLLGIVAYRLSGLRWAGWASALLWALAPWPIRVARTEVMFNAQVFLFALAAVALLHALQARSRRLVIVAGLLIALEAQSRIASLAHPFALAGLALCGVLATPPIPWRRLAAALGLGFGLSLPWFPIRLANADGYLADAGGLRLTTLWGYGESLLDRILSGATHEVLLSTEPASPLIWPLFLAGVVVLVLRARGSARPGVAVALLAALASLTFIHALDPGTAFVANTRFYLTAFAFVTVIAGVGGGALVTWLESRRRRVAALAAGLLIVATPLLAWPFLSRPLVENLEYRFLRDQVLPALQDATPGSVALLAPRPEDEQLAAHVVPWLEGRLGWPPGADEGEIRHRLRLKECAREPAACARVLEDGDWASRAAIVFPEAALAALREPLPSGSGLALFSRPDSDRPAPPRPGGGSP